MQKLAVVNLNVRGRAFKSLADHYRQSLRTVTARHLLEDR